MSLICMKTKVGYEIRNMPLEARLQGMSLVYMKKVNFVLHFKTVHMLLLDMYLYDKQKNQFKIVELSNHKVAKYHRE